MGFCKSFKQLLLGGCFLLLLSACGGGGESSGTDSGVSQGSTGPAGSLTTLSGTVVDGYLRGARVFLDRNHNRSYDNGEPTTTTANAGVYQLQVNAGEGDLYPVVVDVLAGQTVDEDTGATLSRSYQLEAPPGRWQLISPLTTLVQQEQEKNPSFSELQAILQVRSALGLDDSVSLFTDYLAHGTGGSQAGSPALAAEYSRAHKAGQAVAALMGRLTTTILANLGGQVSDTERNALSYMLSDQVFSQATLIQHGLDAERNTGVALDPASLVNAMEASIDSARLDSSLLTLYQQRITQNLPTWDMQPPKIISREPQAGGNSSVDMVLSIQFDEPLADSQAFVSLLQVTGPNGLVNGTVSYDAASHSLNFRPAQTLLPFTSYQVSLRRGLADALGNPLGTEQNWSFTTIFDQSPPPLPNF